MLSGSDESHTGEAETRRGSNSGVTTTSRHVTANIRRRRIWKNPPAFEASVTPPPRSIHSPHRADATRAARAPAGGNSIVMSARHGINPAFVFQFPRHFRHNCKHDNTCIRRDRTDPLGAAHGGSAGFILGHASAPRARDVLPAAQSRARNDGRRRADAALDRMDERGAADPARGLAAVPPPPPS